MFIYLCVRTWTLRIRVFLGCLPSGPPSPVSRTRNLKKGPLWIRRRTDGKLGEMLSRIFAQSTQIVCLWTRPRLAFTLVAGWWVTNRIVATTICKLLLRKVDRKTKNSESFPPLNQKFSKELPTQFAILSPFNCDWIGNRSTNSNWSEKCGARSEAGVLEAETDF